MIDAGYRPQNALTQFLAAGSHADEDGFSETVNSILNAVRLHLHMDIAFVSRFTSGRREFTHITAGVPIPAAPGDSEPMEETFCQRVLDGRLPELIHDASAYPAATELPLTAALPVGSHMNVPLRLKDGQLYGTLCCLSREPDFSLTARDLSTLRAFADLAADQIQQKLDRDRMRIETASRISSILEQDSLSVVYQPIHSLDDTSRSAPSAWRGSPDPQAGRRTSGSRKPPSTGSAWSWKCSPSARRCAAFLTSQSSSIYR